MEIPFFLPPFICRESEACCLAEKRGSGFHKSISCVKDGVFELLAKFVAAGEVWKKLLLVSCGFFFLFKE